MSATYARITRSLPCGNPNASWTDERPVQLTRTDGHVDNPEHNMQRSFMVSCTISADHSSQGEGQPSSSKKRSGSQSRGKKSKRPPPSPTPAAPTTEAVKPATPTVEAVTITAPTTETKSNPPPSRSSKQKLEKESEESGLDSINYLEEMTLVPEALRTNNKPDYKNVSAMYKQY